MSVRLMTLVWERADVPANDLLILLSLADNAGDDGGSCYPSVKLLAIKCRCSERTVVNTLNRLEKKGYIGIIRSGGGRSKLNSYELDVDFLTSLPAKYFNSKTMKKLHSYPFGVNVV